MRIDFGPLHESFSRKSELVEKYQGRNNVPVRQTNVSFNMDLTICYEEASCSSKLIQNIVGSDSCNLGSLVVLVLAIMLVVIKYDPCGCW